MSYNDGQIACSKLFGHIIEFDERVPNYGKYIIVFKRQLQYNYCTYFHLIILNDFLQEKIDAKVANQSLITASDFAPFFISGHKLTGIFKEYDLEYVFYIGLTDHNEEGVWKWASSGRTLNETALESYGYGYGNNGWAHNEPNGKKREDCVAVGLGMWNSDGSDLYDIECTSKLNIICEMSLTNELDVNDLPQQ